MLELAEPDVRLHEAWPEAHREWGPGLHEDGFGIRPEDDLESPTGFAVWVTWLQSRPAELWWIVEGDEVLGGIVLRPSPEMNGRVTGHIGYGIRPSARGRGIATWALTEVVQRAGAAGMPGCLLVCRDDNLASIKTIERCRGELQQTVRGERGTARHYWISTAPSEA